MQLSKIAKNVEVIYQKDGISLYEYCQKYNKSYQKAYYRMKVKGMSFDEAVKNEKLERKIKHTYKGMSIKDYCAKNNLNFRTIMSRISRGQPIEGKLPKKKRACIYYMSDGTRMVDFCKNNNIPYNSVWVKIIDGMAVDDACNFLLLRKGIKR